jgi:hypothetical protein
LYPALVLVNLETADILRRRRIRRPLEECRKAANEADVVALRPRSQTAHCHVFEHALPQRADRVFDG